MRVGFCQFEPVFGEVERNLETVGGLLSKVEADLMVLPELFATGYQFRDRAETNALAETAEGPTVQWALETAKQLGLHLCGGFAEKDGDKIFNSAFLVGPQGPIGVYRKIHLFHRETLCFDPGDGRFDVFDLSGVKVGVMICFDWIFPESMRTMAIKGAQVICHPSNLVLPYCQQSMKTRCLENWVFAVTANRIGSESRIESESLTFTGQSQITGLKMEVLAAAGDTETVVHTVTIDPAQALDKQVNPYNDLLAGRRPEKYFD